MRALTPTLLVAVACGQPERPPSATPAPAVRDSAGIEIVEERLDPTKTIEMVEDLRIGSVDGPEHEQFFTLGDIALTPAGEIVVTDAGNHVIRVFARDGTFLREWGSQGEGPGEFTEFGLRTAVARDTVVVMDRDRIHTFLTSGEHQATVGSPRDRGIVPFEVAAIPGGWRVQIGYGDIFRPPGQPNFGFYPLNPSTGELGDELVGFETRRPEPVSGTNLQARAPFAPRVQGIVGRTGRIYVTRAARYEIEVYSADGDLERIIRPVWERRPITSEILDGWVAYRENLMCGREEPVPGLCEDYVNRILPVELDMPRPEFVPPVSLLSPGDVASGGLLILRRDTDRDLFEEGDPNVFDLFDAAGRYRGRLTAPTTFWPAVLSGDELIGSIRDELDVPYVVRYGLTFP